MSKLTAIVIARNEEEMIGECLDSLTFADQVIVIDNNSTDQTKKIAKEKGAKVISAESTSFAELRNLGKSKAPAGYILYVDADERVTKELHEEILAVLYANDKKIGGYRIPRKNYYLGNHLWPKQEMLARLFRKEALEGWHGALHETAKVKKELADLSSPLYHYTHRDLETMVAKTNEWSEIEAQLRIDAQHPKMTWWRFPRVMVGAFWDSFIRQQGWRAGTAGLIESMFQAFSIFITYAKLWEYQQEEKSK